MIVFISSPFSDDPKRNMQRARSYCRFAVEKGVTPYAPHLLFPTFLSEKTERETALKMGLEMLRRCDEMWCFGGMSAGMKREIAEAKHLGIPVRYFIPAGASFSLVGGLDESIVR